jgi:hypothetical protein
MILESTDEVPEPRHNFLPQLCCNWPMMAYDVHIKCRENRFIDLEVEEELQKHSKKTA